jgi:cytochrome P450
VHTMADMGMKWSQLITPAQLKIVASAIVSVIFLRYLIKHYLNRHTQLKRAPGPFPFWPVVGNLPLLGKLPHHSFYQLSKRYGDIMELKLGSVRTIVVSSPELAKEVLNEYDLVFASRPEIVAGKLLFNGRDIAFSPYGELWRHMRKVSTLELFTLKRLEASKHVRDEELSWLMHGIFENCKEGQPVNIQTSLANALLNVTTRLLFRKRYISTEHTDEDCQEFPALVKKVMILSGLFNISDYVPYLKPFDLQGLTPQFKQTSSKMDRLFDRIIQEHLKEKKTSDEPRDFLDVMLSLPGVEGARDRLDNMAIKGVVHVSCPMHFIIHVWL